MRQKNSNELMVIKRVVEGTIATEKETQMPRRDSLKPKKEVKTIKAKREKIIST